MRIAIPHARRLQRMNIIFNSNVRNANSYTQKRGVMMRIEIKSLDKGTIEANFETKDSFEKTVENISNAKFFVIKYGNEKVAIYVPNILYIIEKK